ncbi:hypothetical protein Rhe02_92770 [Rhizocola hellebori]|uniref:Uncharacterized protein n=1 Tax=Rhizocola hellebori TaxID=1392758 RepID=A0A8J3QK54_9ACTN|nr:hypothetical protein [Rhizocola hellebori]GIH11210.1 hypothetical protein Rhe02_92770 [Rhizocola hellebori]
MKVMASTSMPPATVEALLDLLEGSGGGVQVLDPPDHVRAAWRRILHVLRSDGHIPDGWHLVQRGRNSGDLVLQLRPGEHPSKRYQPAAANTKVTVAEDLVKAHPAVHQLRNQPQRLPASDLNRSRALLLLQTIADKITAGGHTVQCGSQTTLLVVAAELSSIGIRVWEETGKRWALRLTLAVDGPGKQSTTWNDYATQPLEDQLAEILATIREGIRSEEAHRQAAKQAEQKRKELARDRQITEHRAEFLRDQVERWVLAQDIRDHCSQLVDAGMNLGASWLRWANKYADSIDPLSDPPGTPADPQPEVQAVRNAPTPVSNVESPGYTEVRPWHPNRRWYHR